MKIPSRQQMANTAGSAAKYLAGKARGLASRAGEVLKRHKHSIGYPATALGSAVLATGITNTATPPRLADMHRPIKTVSSEESHIPSDSPKAVIPEHPVRAADIIDDDTPDFLEFDTPVPKNQLTSLGSSSVHGYIDLEPTGGVENKNINFDNFRIVIDEK